MHDSSASASVLLTIERSRVDPALRRALEAAAAPGAVMYRPLRELREVAPDEDGLRAMRTADVVIATSGFALRTYLAHPEWRNDGEQHSPALIVLSARMAATARTAGIHRVLVPSEENQHGVAALLRRMRRDGDDPSRAADRPGTTPIGARAVHLCGSLSVPHDALPADVARVRVYENHWDAACEERACGLIAETVETAGTTETIGTTKTAGVRARIGRVLVTSPSAYRRLKPVIARLPGCFADRPVYYTLGPSTTAAVEADGGAVVAPGTHTDVLRAAIDRLIDDLAAA